MLPFSLFLTCVQQLLHHLKVGVGHAVVQRSVPVAVSHVDDVAQHGWRDGPKSPQIVLYHGPHRRLLAGHAKPLVLHRVQTGSLRRREEELFPSFTHYNVTTSGARKTMYHIFTAHSLWVAEVSFENVARSHHLFT